MPQLVSATLFAFLGLLMTAQPAHAQADWVLNNARIYTMDADQPEAEALAVRGERLLMVGAEADVLDAYPDARRIDAGGRTVVPGLIDAHAHLMGLAQSLIQADLVGAESKADIIDRLEAFAQELPEDAWLTGRGWDQNDWPTQTFPTREDLDEAFPDRPVWLVRIDGHAGWANTAAMEAVGMDQLAAMDDPEGGALQRDDSGTPNGIFIDTAMDVIEEAVPAPSSEELDRGLELALEETAKYGLTGVHDAGADLETIDRYQRFIDDGRFPLRVYAMVDGRGETFDHYCAEGLLHNYADRLAVRSVKFYMDGALGSRGAALLSEYSDDPGNTGLLRTAPDVFNRDVQRAFECGFQVNTHAIGDRANRVVLDGYEAATERVGDVVGRHRIEHAQILAPSDIPRFAELDVIASVQPTHATSDMYWAEDRLGPARINGAYAWRSLVDSGARLALGSDFPVEDVDPIEGFHASVTRQDAEDWPEGGWQDDERLTRHEALRGFTLDAAYSAYQEADLGSLESGKLADLVVLSQNIMEVPAQELLATEVIATFVGGTQVYGDL